MQHEMLDKLKVCGVDTVSSSTTMLDCFCLFVHYSLTDLILLSRVSPPVQHHSHFICEAITELGVAQSIFSSHLCSVQLSSVLLEWN